MAGFWSSELVEPKRQFRWYMSFGSNSNFLSPLVYALKKADKPKAKIGEVTHKYLNHSFYFPGRLEWEAINVTFASVSDADATTLVQRLLNRAGYQTPEQVTDRYTFSKEKFAGAIGTIDIIQTNADGSPIEKWTLHNPFFTSVQYGALDYGSDEIVEITTTVRYDWAVLNDVKNGPAAG
jgi:hypothetical protein